MRRRKLLDARVPGRPRHRFVHQSVMRYLAHTVAIAGCNACGGMHSLFWATYRSCVYPPLLTEILWRYRSV